jgi:protein phosphatase-4 regulatory subunit 3
MHWILYLQENIKALILYVIETFWEQDELAKFEHFGSIQAFKLKYNQVEPFLVY